jgi:hypothetical protein
MNLIFRVIAVLWRAWRRSSELALLDPSVLSFRVLPNDLDPNWHVNTLRTGLMRQIVRHRWMPVLGGAVIRYQRPLKLWQRYTLTTQIIGWDEKWIYMEQHFDSEGKRCASALVKGLIRAPDHSVPTPEVMHSVGLDLPSPRFPPHLEQWIAADTSLGAS